MGPSDDYVPSNRWSKWVTWSGVHPNQLGIKYSSECSYLPWSICMYILLWELCAFWCISRYAKMAYDGGQRVVQKKLQHIGMIQISILLTKYRETCSFFLYMINTWRGCHQHMLLCLKALISCWFPGVTVLFSTIFRAHSSLWDQSQTHQNLYNQYIWLYTFASI